MFRRHLAAVLAMLVACSLISCEKMKTQDEGKTCPDTQATGPTKGELKLAYLICNSREETVERFAPAAAYIGQKLGYKIKFIPINTYEVDDDIKKHGFQFAKVNSIVYMQLKKSMDVTLVAGEKRGPLGRFTTGTIIARKGSGIKTIKDLKGKKFSFGPMFAPFGYLVQYDLMLKAGLNPEKDLKYYAIPWGAYKHEKAIYNVQTGVFEAGAGPMLDMISMTETGRIKYGPNFTPEEQDFDIIAESQPAPYCTFIATKDADPKMVEDIKKVLIELKETDLVKMSPEWLEVDGVAWDQPGGFLQSGEVLNVCKSAKMTGYEEAKDSDYDVLREMAKNVGMDPYPRYE